MKKIIKPLVREKSVYYSDVSGKPFGEFSAPVELKISFNYGSKYDGTDIQIDLDDEEVKPVLDLLKNLLSKDFKQNLKDKLEKVENDHYDSMQMRDWDCCDKLSNNIWFWREFLELTNDDKELE